ncbi:MAG: DUF4349 domain-containing protein [Lentisphaeria bacterium]|nr:DUF4349 domain-containing protein [Lentisphaeria bacterium]
MKKNLLFQSLAAAILFSGCTSMENADIRIETADANRSNYSVVVPSNNPPRAMKSARLNVANDAISNGNFNAPAGRKMAFTADITVRVSDIKKAIADTRKQTSEAGGYVKTLNNSMLVLAIPVAKGDAFLNTLGKMGEVANLRIEGDDVTEQSFDIKIRMENLEKSRRRLLALMDRTGNVKDLTQVERELNRVTTELERLQAADKNLNNRIAYVTITVRFQSYIPALVTPRANVPLVWINQLGENLQGWITAGSSKVSVPFRVQLPAKFFFAGGEYAVSGSNCNIRFREINNAVRNIRWYGNDYAGISLYKNMISKALQVRFNGKITCNECKIDGKDALWFQVEKKIYGVDYLYLVAVAVDDDTVKVIEAKGKKKELLSELTIDGWKTMLESIRF